MMGLVDTSCDIQTREQSVQQRLDGFFREVQGAALKIAHLSVPCGDTAADIVQDVMISFHRRYASKPSSQWRALFYRCLHNRIADHFRRRRSRMSLLDRLRGEDETPRESPERASTIGEFGDALDQALHELPERQRQVFLLRAWQGLSVEETALALSISGGSVKTHLYRANEKLRDALQEFAP